MSSDELARLLVDAASNSKKPLTATALHKALPAESRPSRKVVQQALAGLAQARQLFVGRAGRSDVYSTRDLPAEIEAAFRAVLADGPLARTAIFDGVARAVPGSDLAGRKRVFEHLLASGSLFKHPPIKPFRERLGLTPPDPGLYIARDVFALRKVEKTLRAYGVDEEAWRSALARELGLTPPAPAPEPAADGDRASVLGAIRELAALEGRGALLAIRRVRGLRALDKPRFDRALLDLEATGTVTLHYHDFPQSLSPEERAGMLEDERGVFYVGVALRNDGGEAS